MGDLLRFPTSSIPTPSMYTPSTDVRSDRPASLWRELVGDELRKERTARGERLVDVAERAGVSTQYLSEVERGLKDPSSEMLHAIAGALELSVRTLASRVADADVSCLAA